MSDSLHDKPDDDGDDAETTFPASVIEQEAAPLAFTVDDGEAGGRLDAFLAARVEGFSRTRLKQSIEDGDVLVAGRTALKGSHKLRAGDQVELEIPAPPACDFTPEDIPLDIIYEDDSLVVLNKPAGLVVHPAAGSLRARSPTRSPFDFGLRISDCGLKTKTPRHHPTQLIKNQRLLIRNPKSAIRNPSVRASSIGSTATRRG